MINPMKQILGSPRNFLRSYSQYCTALYRTLCTVHRTALYCTVLHGTPYIVLHTVYGRGRWALNPPLATEPPPGRERSGARAVGNEGSPRILGFLVSIGFKDFLGFPINSLGFPRIVLGFLPGFLPGFDFDFD